MYDILPDFGSLLYQAELAEFLNACVHMQHITQAHIKEDGYTW